MSLQIRKAQRKQAKLRVGVSGPSGSGKTYSALLLGRGLASSWEKVLLIDTENGSGDLYSDLGEYNTLPLEAPYTPERYIEAIKAGEDAGMEVIIIDSISHEWDGKGGCLELNEILAASKYKGNTWSAWSETTPRHQRFIEAITTSKCHILTTVRNKIDTVMGDDKKVKKVGTKEITREGFEYELTVNFNVDRETHRAMASKDRTNLFENRDPFVISTETGSELARWNAGGAVDTDSQKREVMAEFKRLKIELPPERHEVKPYVEHIIPKLTGLDWSDENVGDVLAKLKELSPEVVNASLAPEPEPPAPEDLATQI
ncbi:MAG: AAA family ATPase [Sphingopyxis sp.]|nr:AAA family ATPase [Sphingopyxis sp.]